MLSIDYIKQQTQNFFLSAEDFLPRREGSTIKMVLTVNLWHISLLFFSIFNHCMIEKMLRKNRKTSNFYVRNIICLSLNFSLLKSVVFFTGASVSNRALFFISFPVLLKVAHSFYLRSRPIPPPKSIAEQLLEGGHIRPDGEFARKLKEGMKKASESARR